MRTIAIVDWSLSLRLEGNGIEVIEHTFCPKVTGPKGGRLKIIDMLYYEGTLPANYLVPATVDNVFTANSYLNASVFRFELLITTMT